MPKLLTPFTQSHPDYSMVTQYLRQTLPTLTGRTLERPLRLYITEQIREEPYVITGYGQIPNSEGTAAFYEVTIEVFAETQTKEVDLVRIEKLVTSEAIRVLKGDYLINVHDRLISMDVLGEE